jgi:hypothetical protein
MVAQGLGAPAVTRIPCVIEGKTRFPRVPTPTGVPKHKSGSANTLPGVKSAVYKRSVRYPG